MSVAAKPLPYQEAAAIVREQAGRLAAQGSRGREELSLLEAQGRVLAQDLVADRDQPPFARSTRDGFAGRAAEFAQAGPLEVVGLLRAGECWTGGAVPERGCVEIMTGAPVPAFADCVVMVEHVERRGTEIALEAGRVIKAGENVVPAGAEASAGAVVLPEGTRLTAHGVAVAASCGYAQVAVWRRPRVAILSTGDELVELGEQPLAHQIRNSNSWTLAAQVRALGGEPVLAPPVRDDAAALEAAIRTAAATCDLVVLSGGVSMGKYDLVEPALEALGGRFLFTGARIQPGKPVVFGLLEGSGQAALPFFGLPGNPVSTIVCFALFVAPVLAALAGERGYAPRFVQARLRGRLECKPGLTRFLPAQLTHAIEGGSVEVVAWQGSGDLAATAQANCFAVAPEPEGQQGGVLVEGAIVSVLLA
ncbi:gephyrin-like molybdotransferase Glp [Acidipila sp. EB88]|uniref:molybdopterin molybdotransferase MoeA n=1 Tax=Acidipila sp. EB88 TaxID=2305226 RepID=UPI000F5E100B|nr:gephyrin-like molybdotransferase Glp [Acidipila sp. EB88]RRA48620.1 molybdopterin molybdenumtransferase MoeA [Acidipila sp. EB88]